MPGPPAETRNDALWTLIQAIADAILVVDPEGTVLLANTAAEELFGTVERLAGELFGRPLVGGETTEIQIPRAGSHPRAAEMRVVEIEWEGRAAYLASLRDVTERKRAEEYARYVARTLQESLLPATLPEIPAVEAAAYFRPAGQGHQVGGDFYDVFDLDDGSWALVVGDVRGKGPHAAAITALARYTVRAAAVHERVPSRILKLLNDAILRQRPSEEFCTAVYGRLETNGGGKRLTLSIGGHPPPMLLRRDGGVEPVGRAGTLLGFDPDPDVVDQTVALRSGDALVFYTDGLTDAYAPRRVVHVGELARLVESCAGLSAGHIAECISSAALDVPDVEPRDDIAILVLRIATDTGDGGGLVRESTDA